MADRDAVATLAGFQFQFLKTLEAILELENEQSVTIEGVFEDIDISNLAQEAEKSIQCKYHGYTQSKFVPSDIKKALARIFQGHKSNPDIKYYLYIYHHDWGKHNPTSSLEFVAKCLGFSETDTTVSIKLNEEEHVFIEKGDLKNFCDNLSIEKAEEISIYRNRLCEKLAEILEQKKEVVESYYLPNALDIIFLKAID